MSHIKQTNKDTDILIVGHLNINSVRNKIFALHDIIIEKYIDVFALTGTKIDSSFPNAQFSVENFTLHRNDRNSHGGGIICYVRSDIPHRRRHDIESKVMLNQGTDMIVIEMQIYEQENGFLISYISHQNLKMVHLRDVSLICVMCW